MDDTQQTFASRASTGDPDTTVGDQTAYATGSARERWCNRRYKTCSSSRPDPGRAGDNFARLGLNIAEADFLFIGRQMRMVATGKLAPAPRAFTAT